MDIIRLLLWQPALLGHSLGLINTLENFYLMLLLFGLGLKVLGGILAILLLRKMSKENNPVADDFPPSSRVDITSD